LKKVEITLPILSHAVCFLPSSRAFAIDREGNRRVRWSQIVLRIVYEEQKCSPFWLNSSNKVAVSIFGAHASHAHSHVRRAMCWISFLVEKKDYLLLFI